MRFGQPTPADSLRSPKSPRGVLRLVLLLTFVMLGMQWAAQGKNWAWLTGTQVDSDSLPELTRLDFQVKPQPTKPLTQVARPPASVPPIHSADLSQHLPAEWLASMVDGSLGLTPAEQQGLDSVIQHVRTTSAAGPVPDHVGFVALNEHPERYRGRRLEFRGTLWKLGQLSASPPAPPGHEVYEAWLYTADAGNHPTRVLFTDLPAALQPGERLDQPIEFSGYFLKRYGYETAGGTHLAPLFVATTLVPLTEAVPPVAVPTAKTGRRLLIELLVAIAVSATFIWRVTRTRPLETVPK